MLGFEVRGEYSKAAGPRLELEPISEFRTPHCNNKIPLVEIRKWRARLGTKKRKVTASTAKIQQVCGDKRQMGRLNYSQSSNVVDIS